MIRQTILEAKNESGKNVIVKTSYFHAEDNIDWRK